MRLDAMSDDKVEEMLEARIPPEHQCRLDDLPDSARGAISDVGRLVIETQNVELGPDFALENPDVAPGRRVMVTVSDTGTGISDDIISRVFDVQCSGGARRRGRRVGADPRRRYYARVWLSRRRLGATVRLLGSDY